MSSLYGIDADTPKEATGGSRMQAGIHENVKLLEIAVEDAKTDGTGGKVLRFHFQDPSGDTFTHSEFEIDEYQVKANARARKFDPERALRQEAVEQAARVKQILSTFMPEDAIIIKADSWTAFIRKVVEVAGKAFEGRMLRLKILYNKKDFPTFPRRGLFIQSMLEENTLVIGPKEKVERSIVADEEETVSNSDPFQNIGDGDTVDDVFSSTPAEEAPFEDAKPALAEIDPEEAF